MKRSRTSVFVYPRINCDSTDTFVKTTAVARECRTVTLPDEQVRHPLIYTNGVYSPPLLCNHIQQTGMQKLGLPTLMTTAKQADGM
jgi:hypothetical protein